MRTDPLWNSNQTRTLVARRDAGALIRMGRGCLGWSQGELGKRIGCSASAVSRLEARRLPDLAALQRAARAVGMPTRVLAAAVGLDASSTTTAAAPGPDLAKEDPLAAALCSPPSAWQLLRPSWPVWTTCSPPPPSAAAPRPRPMGA